MMDRRQRIAAQRALTQEALGKLRAAAELFGTEDHTVAGDTDGRDDLERWQGRVADFENWVWGASPVA